MIFIYNYIFTYIPAESDMGQVRRPAPGQHRPHRPLGRRSAQPLRDPPRLLPRQPHRGDTCVQRLCKARGEFMAHALRLREKHVPSAYCGTLAYLVKASCKTFRHLKRMYFCPFRNYVTSSSSTVTRRARHARYSASCTTTRCMTDTIAPGTSSSCPTFRCVVV